MPNPKLDQPRQVPARPNNGVEPLRRLWSPAVLGLLLLGITFLAFAPCLRNDFIDLDDGPYIFSNSTVQRGLTWSGVAWAFTTFTESNWHPLTWLSHMADCQLFGLHPWGHHLTSVLLHSFNAVLLFLLFRKMTGVVWPSFFLAALFGLHPLHVESVAWAAERKDVLSTFFFLLTLLAYVKYAQARRRETGDRRQEPAARSKRSRVAHLSRRSQTKAHHASRVRTARSSIFYLLSSIFFLALGLLSKPMLVSVPFVLLLLDYWPLGRATSDEWRVTGPETSKQTPRSVLHGLRSCLVEKLPFFALALGSSVVTLIAQHPAMMSLGRLTLDTRIENALVSYSNYLGKLFWPLHLAIFYPYPKYFAWPAVILSIVLLLLVSFAAIKLALKFRWLLTGWFWFLITLIPVIGLVQVGPQSMADRYTYIPSIGVLVILVWGAHYLTSKFRVQPAVIAAVGLLTLIPCAAMTLRQISYWKDGPTVFRHALAVTGTNTLAYEHLAEFAFLKEHDPNKAIEYYKAALAAAPFWIDGHNNLAFVLEKVGRLKEAIAESQKAVILKPDSVEARSNLGREFCLDGRPAESVEQYLYALDLKPEIPDLHEGLADALSKQDRVPEAMVEYAKAARLNPNWPEPRIRLAALFCAKGRFSEAAAQCQEALRLRHDDPEAQSLLGAALLELGKPDEAIKLLERVRSQHPNFADVHMRLGLAYYRERRFDEAITEYEQALKLGAATVEVEGNLGSACLNTHRYDEAITHLQAAIHLKPDSFESHHNLGAALWSKGRFGEALDHFKEAVRLAPTSAEAHRDFAFALAAQGRKPEAIDELNEALKLRPGYPEAEQQLRALTGQ